LALTVTTWNVNSVRLRIEGVRRIVDALSPDVLCLQEIKAEDAVFPSDALRELGFAHQCVHGMKSYNGVAILSRKPIVEQMTMDWCGRKDRRHAIATIDGVEIHNFYIPAGGDVPDVTVNEKFGHKLQFMTEIADWFAAERTQAKPMILVGDLNVAPLETDVWSHKELLTVVSHTPIEVAHLARVQASAGWVDAVRHFIPPSQKLYSWWSYRAKDWDLSDRGRRLDHVWVTPPLAPSLASTSILRDARAWEQPSDHVPVTVTLGG
jgi:exodeoxyribonuclease-3